MDRLGKKEIVSLQNCQFPTDDVQNELPPSHYVGVCLQSIEVRLLWAIFHLSIACRHILKYLLTFKLGKLE